MTKQKLKTFSSMSKGITSKNSSGDACSIKNDRDLFARLLIGKSQNIDTQELLSYAFKQAPLPFANINSSMVKTDKSKLMHAIEDSVTNPVVSEVPVPNNALVVDSMALLQQLTKCEVKTFSDLADEILLMLIIAMAKRRQSTQVDFVGECGTGAIAVACHTFC